MSEEKLNSEGLTEKKPMGLLNQKVSKVNEKKYDAGGMEKTKGKRNRQDGTNTHQVAERHSFPCTPEHRQEHEEDSEGDWRREIRCAHVKRMPKNRRQRREQKVIRSGWMKTVSFAATSKL